MVLIVITEIQRVNFDDTQSKLHFIKDSEKKKKKKILVVNFEHKQVFSLYENNKHTNVRK